MTNWNTVIADCIENESQRFRLKAIPLPLLSSVEYAPDYFYLTAYLAAARN